MEDEDFEGLMRRLEGAIAHQRGRGEGCRVHVVEVPSIDVKALRDRLGMTRADFAAAFGFELRAIREWEDGRRIPRGLELSYLRVIEREPEAVRRVLAD